VSGTARAVGRLTAAVVLVVADLVFLVTAPLPWSVEGSTIPPDDTSGTVLRTLSEIGFGPALTALLLARLWRGGPGPVRPGTLPWRRVPGRAGRDVPVLVLGAGGALLSAVQAAVALDHLPVNRGLHPAATVAVAAASAAVLAWAALALLTPGPVWPGRVRVAVTGSAAAVVTVAALVAATVPAVRWYTTGRFLRHDTAAALPAVPDTPPRRLDRVRWQARIAAAEHVQPVLTGRYLLVPEHLGARAVDAVTGSQQWTYLRSDVTQLLGVVPAADGRTTVLLYLGRMHELAVGLDTATGAVRWEHRTSLGRGLGSDPVTATAGSLLVLGWEGAGGSRVLGLSFSDGRVVWSTGPADKCTLYSPPAIAGSTVVYSEHCPRVGERVVALSTADGHRLWTWRPGRPDQYVSVAGDGALRAVPGGLLATYSLDGDGHDRRSAALLDPATGAVRTRYAVPGRWTAGNGLPETRALPAGAAMLYLGARTVAVDPRTGRPRWSRPLPDAAGWHPIQAVVRGRLAYALLLAEPTRDSPATRLRLLAVRTDTGEVTLDIPYPSRRCGSECGPAAETLLLAGPGVLVVDEAAGPTEPEVCFLSAIG
jgi:outer membrane protein assembly factor BamB